MSGSSRQISAMNWGWFLLADMVSLTPLLFREQPGNLESLIYLGIEATTTTALCAVPSLIAQYFDRKRSQPRVRQYWTILIAAFIASGNYYADRQIPGEGSVAATLQRVVSQFQDRLPIQVANGISIVAVTADATTVTFSYRVSTEMDELHISDSGVAKQVCEEKARRDLLNIGVTLRIQYFNGRDKLLFSKEVTARDCSQ